MLTGPREKYLQISIVTRFRAVKSSSRSLARTTYEPDHFVLGDLPLNCHLAAVKVSGVYAEWRRWSNGRSAKPVLVAHLIARCGERGSVGCRGEYISDECGRFAVLSATHVAIFVPGVIEIQHTDNLRFRKPCSLHLSALLQAGLFNFFNCKKTAEQQIADEADRAAQNPNALKQQISDSQAPGVRGQSHVTEGERLATRSGAEAESDMRGKTAGVNAPQHQLMQYLRTTDWSCFPNCQCPSANAQSTE